jgi:hypothetical protein
MSTDMYSTYYPSSLREAIFPNFDVPRVSLVVFPPDRPKIITHTIHHHVPPPHILQTNPTSINKRQKASQAGLEPAAFG